MRFLMVKTHYIASVLYLVYIFILPQLCEAAKIIVTTSQVPLITDNTTKKSLGLLSYRGGLLLTSENSNFGGFSALGISSDGNRLIALSDRGSRLAGNLSYDKKGNLTGLKNTHLDQMTAPGGGILLNKSLSDAEAMSPGVEGEIIVAFERQHRIWRYLPNNPEPKPIPSPRGIEKLPFNNGIESLALLSDGSLLAIAEGTVTSTETIGWISNPRGWSPFTYKLSAGFRPTGATTLHNGDLIVLERFYTPTLGNKSRIRRIPKNIIKPGSELDGSLLAELLQPGITENFEGIDARYNKEGHTYIYIISDDNFNKFQNTYLLMFKLVE